MQEISYAIPYAGCRIRTCVGTKPVDLESTPFGHSGNPATTLALIDAVEHPQNKSKGTSNAHIYKHFPP